ncbi:SDR family NAD(P)-dependent oxidoreductase [Deinococcus planocerae]|uniref:SDR family NAD(P)-dependent oxidoreductase n=1 Tax=Deinococcus planocerae TaxID=1737569 RepID=UPI000C7F2F25|nr:SDR family NAD(P)-dependent oxidoreductase [Deinococcus planocerae]
MPSTQQLGSRVALVTGGTSGIGREVALDLARRGTHVFIVGRDQQRAQEVVRRGNGLIEFLAADLSRMSEVRRLASEVLSRTQRLDLLVHSAGVHHLSRELTPEGVEVNFAANYLSRFLLTELLLERLQHSAPARIVVLGSPYKFDPARFMSLRGLTAGEPLAHPLWALAQSGMAISVWTVALARRLAGTGVTVNNVHPGFVQTGILRTYPLAFRLVDYVLQFFVGMTAEEGARAPLYLATSPDMNGQSGQFFVTMNRVLVPKGTYAPQVAERLWTFSGRLTHPQETAGKLVLITGGSRGLGFETARKLAQLGFRVILTSRTQRRADEAAARLRAAVPGADIRGEALDLANFASVHTFAGKVRSRESALHVLVLNAAQMPGARRRLNDQGIETTLAANHLGHFLLTNELRPLLETAARETGEARVLVVSSRLHKAGILGPGARFDFGNVNLSRAYRPMVAYKNSKLANVWFAYELNRRLAGTGITANALCPNFVPQTISGKAPGLARWFYRGIAPRLPFARSLDEATDTYVYLATSPAMRGVGGRFYGESQAISSSPDSYDEEKARRLWALSEELTDTSFATRPHQGEDGPTRGVAAH